MVFGRYGICYSCANPGLSHSECTLYDVREEFALFAIESSNHFTKYKRSVFCTWCSRGCFKVNRSLAAALQKELQQCMYLYNLWPQFANF